MKLIAHRGNLHGRIPQMENNPQYITKAIEAGYDVEIDVWAVGDRFFLGHDAPLYPVTPDWLCTNADSLWIHVKSLSTIPKIKQVGNSLNWFWHESDKMTLTSHGFVWCYVDVLVPGTIVNQPTKDSPFWWMKNVSNQFLGLCSDTIVDDAKQLELVRT